MLFKDMKGVNFSCASPASAAICASIEPRSIVQPRGRRKAIEYHTLSPRDARRAKANNSPPQLPSKAKSKNHNSNRKTFERAPVKLNSPASSSRYLLTDTTSSDVPPEAKALTVELPKVQSPEEEESSISTASSSPSSSSNSQEQVVVLRVSLHCKACETKLRKHISKMPGLKSFGIDFAKKKVTVIGNVTPLGVLNSVSKVKKAQFWPLPPPSNMGSPY